MSDRLAQLEARVEQLTDTVRQLQNRLAVVEGGHVVLIPKTNKLGESVLKASEESGVEAVLRGLTLALVGRTLLVLAGAFLLRALTESGAVPVWLGVTLGFAYAGTWIVMAYRVGRDEALRPSAGLHGVAAMMIGFPLLVEAATRFALLTPVLAAVVLTGLCGVALAVATRRDNEPLAVFITFGALPTAVALAMMTGHLAPVIVFLVLLGVATLWLGYVLDWPHSRWPVAVVVDVMLVMMALRVVRGSGVERPGAALAVLILFMALYLASIAVRTLVLNRQVVAFEIAQTTALVAVGLGGASYVAAAADSGAAALGIASIVLGIAAYAVAFTFVERRQRITANFYFYTSVAIVFVLGGTTFLLPRGALPFAWAALAVLVGVLSRSYRRLTLAAHAAVYAVCGALASGLPRQAAEATLESSDIAWSTATLESIVLVAAMGITAWLTGSPATASRTRVERVPRLLLVAALAVASASIVIGWLVPVAAGVPGVNASAGAVATVRTAVLVGGVLLLAWIGRSDSWLEARWLAYPALVAIGLKMVLEDLPRSRPATLFLAFGLYGIALILVPRLRRRDAPIPAAAPADATAAAAPNRDATA
ncbi:MAG TPA: hypothetical protein VFK85_06255 [Anaeromyxobacteraceae bacterium]|nr:hypothetical protein [Anaeromyxobacteraceae bacterium]